MTLSNHTPLTKAVNTLASLDTPTMWPNSKYSMTLKDVMTTNANRWTNNRNRMTDQYLFIIKLWFL